MDCIGVEAIDLEEWGQILTAPLEGGRYLLSATFELTSRCNFNCVHCFINEAPNDASVRAQELGTEQVKKIIDQMVDAGVLFLTMTGGEPLLRPDFTEIYSYARHKGMLVILFTNGSMVSEEIADVLDNLRPFNVEISLYGATRETFEAVTRQSGSFDRALAGIQRMIARGIPLTLKTELMTLNYHELRDMRAMADQLEVKLRYDGLLWPRLDGSSKFPVDVQLPVETLIQFDSVDEVRQQAVRDELVRLAGLKTRDERVYSCGAGLRNFHIDSAGRMSICLMARSPSYDLKKMPVIEAWEKIGAVRQRKRQLPSKCTSCIYNQLCSQCPGWSQVIHNDDESVVEFICKLGSKRSENALNLIHLIKEES